MFGQSRKNCANSEFFSGSAFKLDGKAYINTEGDVTLYKKIGDKRDKRMMSHSYKASKIY